MSLPATAASVREDVTDPSGLVGRVLAGRYKVTGLLGVGGIGRVYRAEHVGLKRQVAIKVLLEHYACVPDLQRRFEREAMALAALSHPNIVTITDFVSTRDVTFLVMELVEGTPLDDLLDEALLPPAQAFDVMEQLLSSLAYAHEREVVHRDLKPSNILVRYLAAERIHAEVLDFGLAKFMDGSGPSANLTKTGLIVGTPAYMAPEQASGAHVGKGADVYAAGILFFEMLAGVHPFEGLEGQELLRHHLLKPAPTLGEMAVGAEVHPDIEAFFARALAKDEGDRYRDGATMLGALLALPRDGFVPLADAGIDKPVRLRPTDPTAIAPARKIVSEAPASAARRPLLGWPAAFVVVALVLGALGALYLAVNSGGSETPPVDAPSTQSTHPASVDEADGAPGVADPEAVTDPGVADPDVADPDVAEPDVAEPDVAEPDVADPDDESTDEVDEDEVEEAAEPAAEIVRVPARNPWRGRTPSELNRVRRLLRRGSDVSRRQIRDLQRYRAAHPQDPRPWLLLAQISMSRGARTNALRRYRSAYRRDGSARGDATMRRQLVQLAGYESTHAEAVAAIVEIYGTEATTTLERAVRTERDAGRRTRLEAALQRLR